MKLKFPNKNNQNENVRSIEYIVKSHMIFSKESSFNYSLHFLEDFFKNETNYTDFDDYVIEKENDFERNDVGDIFFPTRIQDGLGENDLILLKDDIPIATAWVDVFSDDEKNLAYMIRRIQGASFKRRSLKPNFFNFNFREFLVDAMEEIGRYNGFKYAGIISAEGCPFLDSSFTLDRAKKVYNKTAENMGYKPFYGEIRNFSDLNLNNIKNIITKKEVLFYHKNL